MDLKMLPTPYEPDGLTSMDSKRYALRWRHHQSTVVAEVGSLFREAALVDVTLACEDQRTYQAHKLVLSACSQYFQALFSKHPAHQHPIIFLKDVNGDECQALLTFMYRGEVSVNQEQIQRILQVATSLQIRGLAEVEQHSSRPTSPLPDRGTHSISPHSPSTCPPPKSVTPTSEPPSPAPQSMPVNCSLGPQTPSISSQNQRPAQLSNQEFSPLGGYLLRPGYDLGSVSSHISSALGSECDRKRDEKSIPPYNAPPQLRVKPDLGGSWESSMEGGSLASHAVLRDGPRFPFPFSSFMNLEQNIPAGSPGFGPPFSIRDPLNRLTNTDRETRIHKCNYCSRKFKRKDHLKTHVRIHTGERPYKCKICGRGFIQSQQVKIHMKVHIREDPAGLGSSSVLGSGMTSGGLGGLSSIYSDLSNQYNESTNERHRRSHQEVEPDSHPSGQHIDGESDNDLSSDMMDDSKMLDASSSRFFQHPPNILSNQRSSLSSSHSPTQIESRTDGRSSPISHLNRTHINSSPDDGCLKEPSPCSLYSATSNIKK